MRQSIVTAAIVCLLGTSLGGAAPRPKDPQNKKETYQRKIQSELNDLSAKIQALEAKAEKAGAATRTDLKAQVKKLKTQKDAAQKHLEELKSSTTEGWDKLKVGMDKAVKDLKSPYRKAVSDFK